MPPPKSNESFLRSELVRLSRSLFDRSYSVGTAGNISIRLADGFLMTPTNSSLGHLDASKISKLDKSGKHISGDKPSKEVFLHNAFYESRPQTGAVVHLHSSFATAISCLADTDPENCIPPVTPYVVMRVGPVKLVPYVHPGDAEAGDLIRSLNGKYAAILLANHGPVVCGKDLHSAVHAAEELEETAKLLVTLQGQKIRYLTETAVSELNQRFAHMRD